MSAACEFLTYCGINPLKPRKPRSDLSSCEFLGCIAMQLRKHRSLRRRQVMAGIREKVAGCGR